MKIFLLVFYALLSIGVLASHGAEITWLNYVCKPLLMPILLIYMMREVRPYWLDNETYMMLGLLAAWWGDVFLIFSAQWTFILGLAGFLVMQICYMQIYRNAAELPLVNDKPQHTFLRKNWFLPALPFLILAGGAYYIMYPNLPDRVLRIAVLVYAFALSMMVILALNRWNRVPSTSFTMVFAGAFLFMISDLIIGLSRFAPALEISPKFGSIAIMFTYVVAQFLIIEGVIRESKGENIVRVAP